MVVGVANIVATLGGIILIAGLIWAARNGNGDRDEEQAARDFFTEHGYWPDEAPEPPR
jgi:hypothetical protein